MTDPEHAHEHDTNGDRYRCPVTGCWWTAGVRLAELAEAAVRDDDAGQAGRETAEGITGMYWDNLGSGGTR